MAAAQLGYRVAFGEEWRDVAESHIVAGPGRDAYIEARAAYASDTSSRVAQTAGFRFVSYTDDTAAIES